MFRRTPAALKRLRELTKRGVGHTEIAAELGCVDPRTVRKIQLELGLVAPHVKQPWTKKEVKLLRKMYPNSSVAELVSAFNRPIERIYAAANVRGIRRSAEYMASPAAYSLRRRGYNPGKAFQYPKGHVPANKGLRRPGYSPGRMSETQFKKGNLSGFAAELVKPVGTILADHEGYLRIKIKEQTQDDPRGWTRCVWPLLSWHNWEKANGRPVPPGHNLVFIDGDRNNCEVDNLELLSDAELMRRNTIHNLPPKLKEVIHLKAAIRAHVTRRKKREANAKEKHNG